MTPPKNDPRPLIAITMGDPRGVGPEVTVKALAQESLHRICSPLVLGDRNVLQKTVQFLGLGLKVVEAREELLPSLPPGVLSVLSLSRLSPGPNPVEIPPEESSRASFAYVEKAGRMVSAGAVEAIACLSSSTERGLRSHAAPHPSPRPTGRRREHDRFRRRARRFDWTGMRVRISF